MAGATPGPAGASLAASGCILDTASGSSTRGVRVDTVVAASRVAKATLKKHFPRKDDLVLSHLEKADRPGAIKPVPRPRLPVTTP